MSAEPDIDGLRRAKLTAWELVDLTADELTIAREARADATRAFDLAREALRAAQSAFDAAWVAHTGAIDAWQTARAEYRDAIQAWRPDTVRDADEAFDSLPIETDQRRRGPLGVVTLPADPPTADEAPADSTADGPAQEGTS